VAFAEVFLRSGVEAYLGTFWRVGDSAASTFAKEVYSKLSEGQTLEEAVKNGRAMLLDAREPDWANYVLYGDGRFQLVVE
jgi:CHAT domain-containing protein